MTNIVILIEPRAQEFNQSGMISKTKERRLLLLNDLLVCVTVVSKAADDFRNSERFTLKWAFPITDIEVSHVSLRTFLKKNLFLLFHICYFRSRIPALLRH